MRRYFKLTINSPYRQHSMARTFLFRLVLVSLIAISAYLIFEFGRIKAGYNFIEAGIIEQTYVDSITMLNAEISELKQEIAVLTTNIEVDRESYKVVEANLASLQVKIQEQRDAIAFYREIVSPSDGNSNLRVQDLKLTHGKKEREINIRLVLAQSMKHDRKVSGNVNLRIFGNQDGIETSYTITQLLPEGAERAWIFSFRYFQDFDRHFILPVNFTPNHINVEVRSKNQSISDFEKDYVWIINQS